MISSPRRARLSLAAFSVVLLLACGGSGAPVALGPWIVEAAASTSENRYHTAEFAFDGDLESRWSSRFEDNQWVMGRLASPARIDQVVLRWEDACASEYVVEGSIDQKAWTEFARRTEWAGGADTINVSPAVEAAYVRVTCIKRKTDWGNSLFEIELHGTPGGAAPAKSLAGYEAAPEPWDTRCREIRDRLMAAAAKDPRTSADMTDDEFLDLVSRRKFDFFWYETNPDNGLTLDQAENFRSSERHRIASVANAGFALTAYCIGAKRGWVTRDEAAERIRKTLDFFLTKMEHRRGFYYHFVDMFTGERDPGSELSSIDSALFFCGVIAVAEAFKDDTTIATSAAAILDRVDWQWMLNGHPHFPAHGANPDGPFLNSRWGSTTEGMLCYLVGIGAPKNPMPAASWNAFDRHAGDYQGYRFVIEYGAQSIFRFQYPCLWYDFRNRHDAFADYFENGVEATLAMRQYCLDIADRFPKSYGPMLWGLGAANGPGDRYMIYGFPPGDPYSPADGTVVVYGIAGSVPFVPHLAIPALRYIYDNHHQSWGKYGFTDAINPQLDFVTRRVVGLDEGTALIAIENYRSGYIWELFMRHPLVKRTTAGIGWTMRPVPSGDAAPVDLSGDWKFRTGDGNFEGDDASKDGWRDLLAPDRWDNQDLALRKYDGIGWYRRTFVTSGSQLAAWERDRIVFHSGGIDDIDEVWVNGTSIGKTAGEGAFAAQRLYEVPRGLIRPGENSIAVRVTDKGGHGGLWRRPLRIGPFVAADWQPINPEVSRLH
jgi:hypothetical protein